MVPDGRVAIQDVCCIPSKLLDLARRKVTAETDSEWTSLKLAWYQKASVDDGCWQTPGTSYLVGRLSLFLVLFFSSLPPFSRKDGSIATLNRKAEWYVRGCVLVGEESRLGTTIRSNCRRDSSEKDSCVVISFFRQTVDYGYASGGMEERASESSGDGARALMQLMGRSRRWALLCRKEQLRASLDRMAEVAGGGGKRHDFRKARATNEHKSLFKY